jgi:hypothetical protein
MSAQGYVDENGIWHEPGDDPYAAPDPTAAPAPAPAPATNGTDAAAGAGTPDPYKNPAGYQDIDYWTAHGRNPMGPDGNLAPGFKRTANGYEYTAPTITQFDDSWTRPTGWTCPMRRRRTCRRTNRRPPSKPPTPEEALSDPGYQFRVQQGTDALQRWAAARGTLNDSGTANALTDYGQNAATQEYANVFDRNLGTYKVNTQTQYVDPYNMDYRRAGDLFAPVMEGWRARVADVGSHNMANRDFSFRNFLQRYNIYKDNRDAGFGGLMANPYRYDAYDPSGSAESIGRLLLQRGAIEGNRSTQVAGAQARAAEQSGQAWGGCGAEHRAATRWDSAANPAAEAAGAAGSADHAEAEGRAGRGHAAHQADGGAESRRRAAVLCVRRRAGRDAVGARRAVTRARDGALPESR